MGAAGSEGERARIARTPPPTTTSSSSAAAAAIPDIEGLRFVLDREDHRDTVVAEVVVTAGADEAQVLAEAGERIRSALRFRADVRAVEQLPSDEPIDDRRTWD